jgi:hypothetical protein
MNFSTKVLPILGRRMVSVKACVATRTIPGMSLRRGTLTENRVRAIVDSSFKVR